MKSDLLTFDDSTIIIKILRIKKMGNAPDKTIDKTFMSIHSQLEDHFT